MGSITQKGKPSDHGSISTANASNSQASATSAATPGIGNLIIATALIPEHHHISHLHKRCLKRGLRKYSHHTCLFVVFD